MRRRLGARARRGGSHGGGFRLEAHGLAFGLVDLEGAALPDQVAEFAKAISARVEVGGDVREALSHRAQADPAIFRLHLHHGLVQDGDGRARRLQALRRAPFLGGRNLGLG